MVVVWLRWVVGLLAVAALVGTLVTAVLSWRGAPADVLDLAACCAFTPAGLGLVLALTGVLLERRRPPDVGGRIDE